MSPRILRSLAWLSLVAVAPLAAQTTTYHLARTDSLGGDGGWDYIGIDNAAHRIFLTRSDRVMVVDETTGKPLGEVAGLQRGHGTVVAGTTGHAFSTSGGDGMVVMWDAKTLQVLHRGIAAPDADGILYDTKSGHVFTMNGDAGSATAVDAMTGDPVAQIDLHGKPEFGVSDGAGSLFINLEDSAQIAQVDVAKDQLVRKWSIAPCQSPTGLAIDVAHHRLFSGCRNQLLVISDLVAGKVVATAPIGNGVDATRFDPATQLAFASNGEGSITVVHEVTPDSFVVAQTIATKRGARTMEIDLATHRLFTATADYAPMPAPAPGAPRQRPPMVPGSFAMLEYMP